MCKLKLIDSINIENPYNILPNEDSHIIVCNKNLDINGYKLNITSCGIRFSDEGYLLCSDLYNNKINKLDNFKIINSYDIYRPYDMLINNNEIVAESNEKCKVYDYSLNEIKTIDIKHCAGMNMNNDSDIFICDYGDDKVKVYSYNYDFKYSIDIDRPSAITIMNDDIFISAGCNRLYCFTDKLENIQIRPNSNFIQSEKNKLYIPNYKINKINIYEPIYNDI